MRADPEVLRERGVMTWVLIAAGTALAALGAFFMLRSGIWLWRNGKDLADFQNREAERRHGRFSIWSRPAQGWIYKLNGAQILLGFVVIIVFVLGMMADHIR